jgi:hypothetical protein
LNLNRRSHCVDRCCGRCCELKLITSSRKARTHNRTPANEIKRRSSLQPKEEITRGLCERFQVNKHVLPATVIISRAIPHEKSKNIQSPSSPNAISMALGASMSFCHCLMFPFVAFVIRYRIVIMAATPGEQLTGSKYSVHTVTFRSIKRARDLFLADYRPFPLEEEDSYVAHDAQVAFEPHCCCFGVLVMMMRMIMMMMMMAWHSSSRTRAQHDTYHIHSLCVIYACSHTAKLKCKTRDEYEAVKDMPPPPAPGKGMLRRLMLGSSSSLLHCDVDVSDDDVKSPSSCALPTWSFW